MEKPILARSEWDFSKCLDQDRGACVQYEYAREFLRKRADLKEKLRGAGRVEHLLRFQSFLFTSGKPCSDYFPILCDDFPAMPWLDLPRDLRTTMRTFREADSELLAPDTWELQCLANFTELRQKRFQEWQENAMQWVETNGYVNGKKVSFLEIFTSLPHAAFTPTHLYRYFGGIDYALIKLDWSKNNNELIAAFEQLLRWRPSTFAGAAKPAKQLTKSDRIPFHRSGGRGGPVDQLRQLSALRLKTHYGDSKNVISFLEEQKSDLPHKNVRSIENGAGKARAVLRRMERDGRFSVFSGLT